MMYPTITENQTSMYVVPMIQLEEREEILSPVVWFLVAIVILLALSITIVGAMAVFCIARGGSFTGNWSYKNWGFDVSFSCTQ